VVAARRRNGEQLRAQKLDQIVRGQARAFEALRGARDLVAVKALEPLQRGVDAAGAGARQIQIGRTQVIPPARGVLVVVVQARRQLGGELVARQPAAASARRLVQRRVQPLLLTRQPTQIGAAHAAKTGPKPGAGPIHHATDHRREPGGRTRVAA